MYILTEEGKRYLEEGLPEARLLDLLNVKKKVSIEDAKKSIEDFSVAIQWAKKNKWIGTKDGFLEISRIPKNIPEQDALEKVNKNEVIDESVAAILVGRNLIEKERDDIVKKAKQYIGKEVASLPKELIKTGLWKGVKLRKYNVEVPGKRIYPGKRQPYNRFLNNIRQKLVEQGFVEKSGSAVELEFWNFDALFQAQDHPSRDWTQTYSMKNPTHGSLPDWKIVENVKSAHENGWRTGSSGWGYKWDPEKAAKLMPIAHDTAISPKILSSSDLEIPGKYFQIVRCYRPDVIDATHGVEFNQMGGIVVGEDLNFRDLLGLLKSFAVDIGGCEPDSVKFLSDYYPFTEPSVQVSANHPEMGMVELAGAGIFREELTKPLGIDVPVIAWGFGVDRLAMYKLGISDIRELFTQNLDWLRSQTIVM